MTNPETGVWLSEDGEVRAPDPYNLYRYVGNGPTNATDPSGLDSIRVIAYRWRLLLYHRVLAVYDDNGTLLHTYSFDGVWVKDNAEDKAGALSCYPFAYVEITSRPSDNIHAATVDRVEKKLSREGMEYSLLFYNCEDAALDLYYQSGGTGHVLKW